MSIADIYALKEDEADTVLFKETEKQTAIGFNTKK
jgi:hypothetical protein